MKSSNNQEYLEIKAKNHYEFGYLRGLHLRQKIKIGNRGFKAFLKAYKLSFEEFLSYSKYYTIPKDYRDEICGIADGTGLKYEHILMQKLWIDIYYGKIVPMLSEYPQPPLIIAGCTAIGSNTGRKAILGQTIDISLLMQPTASWVYTKIQGKKVFSFRTGGMLAMGGVNKRGLAISVNLLEVLNLGCIGKPISVIYRSALENAKNVRQAMNIILDNDFTLGWNFIIRDKRLIVVLETIPNSYTLERVGRGSYTFDANIYENPYFKKFMIYPTKYVERYDRVSELCQTYNQDGKLDINDLFEIYSDTLISRKYTTPDPLYVGTAGSFFIDTKNNVYFCLGNPLDSRLGIISSFN